jgi:hypothetical protein
MRSIIAVQKAALNAAKEGEEGPIKELAEVCSDLALYVESLQRQLDEMKRHDNRRRQGL